MRTIQFLTLSLLTTAVLMQAGALEIVTVNTTSLNGTTGSIDFQFNPGLAAQGATLQIQGFNGATYIAGSDQQIGAASGGPVPTAITLSNTQADNEDFEDVRFGTTLTFDVLFSGAAFTSPNGLAGNQSTFAFSMFSDLAGTIPISGANSLGNVADITVNAEGELVNSAISPNARIAAVPEPSAVWLMLAAGSGAFFGMKSKWAARRSARD